MSPAEIAEKLGCSLSTLRVRCSEAGISLKRPYGRVGIPRDAINAVRDRAAMLGTSEAVRISMLIECTVADDLFDAILDGRPIRS